MELNFLLPLEDLFEEDAPSIERAIVSTAKDGKPLTILLWSDGTKTMTKCHEQDAYNKELGLMLCVAKKALPASVYRAYCNMLESEDPVAAAKEYIVSHLYLVEYADQSEVDFFLETLKSENRYMETARLIAQYYVPQDYQYLKRQARRK